MRKKIEDSSDPLPYTQVDRAVLPIAATLAGALDVSRQHALGSLIEFWSLNGDPRTLERLLGEGKSEVVKSGEEIRRVFKLASGKTLEPDAMVDLGLLEKKGENVFRVRGMSRYFEPIKARLEARARGRAAGLASAAVRKDVRGSAQPGFDGGSTDAEQPSNIPRTPPNQRSAVSGQRATISSKRSDRDLAGSAGKHRPKLEQPELPGTPPAPPKPPRAPSRQEQALEIYASTRRDVLKHDLELDDPPDDVERPEPAHLNRVFGRILAAVAHLDRPEPDDAFRGFELLLEFWFAQDWAVSASPPFPITMFMACAFDRPPKLPGENPRPGLVERFLATRSDAPQPAAQPIGPFPGE